MTTVDTAGELVRPDGREKVTGDGRYAADLVMAGMLHAKFKYAAHSHARVLAVDTKAARALSGVLAVVTQDDVPDVRHGVMVKDRTLFAHEVVRFEGEVVAAVAATSEAIAEQAVALITVEYEPLEPVSDMVKALEPGAPLVHDRWDGYEAAEGVVRSGNTASYARVAKGDAEAGIEQADVVVSERFVSDMAHAVPIEPRAILAQWEGDKVTIWSSTQVPFGAREGVAETLSLAQNQVRIVVPLLGGGFGGKCEFHFEAHVAALARAARRPVRLLLNRREEFTVTNHRRENTILELETGVRADGTVTARRGRIIMDNGAYTHDAAAFPQSAAMYAVGPYRVPNVSIDAHLVYTNRMPSGSVRAPNGPQTCWALEQHMDSVAAAVGLDAVEFRRRNLVTAGDEGPSRQVYSQSAARECLDQALELVGHGEPLPPDEAIGVACGFWPSESNASGANIKINGDGSVTIVTGAQECGTGAVMALPVLAAEVLGMLPEDFSLVYQDTGAGPWDEGALGSQTTVNNGRAVVAAAEQVRDQLLEMAADELEVDPGDLYLADRAVRVKGSPGSAVTIRTLAAKAQKGRLLLGIGSGTPPSPPECDLSACVGRLGFEAFTAPSFFAQAARVKLDRETGVPRVLHVAASHDAGRVLNPPGARGQVLGGVAMGIGLALTEGAHLSADGHQLNPSLLDYKLLTSADMPRISVGFVDSPAPDGGPHGIKGMGEQPIVPTAGAIANAIRQLIGQPVLSLPMTPERVWATSQDQSP